MKGMGKTVETGRQRDEAIAVAKVTTFLLAGSCLYCTLAAKYNNPFLKSCLYF